MCVYKMVQRSFTQTTSLIIWRASVIINGQEMSCQFFDQLVRFQSFCEVLTLPDLAFSTLYPFFSKFMHKMILLDEEESVAILFALVPNV